MMKYVCIIARGYPSERLPMAGIFEFEQAKALKAYGNKVVFLSLDLRSIRKIRKLGIYSLVKEGICIYNISWPLGGLPFRLFYALGKCALSCLFRKVVSEQGRPDVLHAHFVDLGALTAHLKEKYDIPFVHTEHSSLMNQNSLTKDVAFYAHQAYSKCDRLICVSQALSRNILRLTGHESRVIPNVADFQHICLAPQKQEAFTFVSIGNLIRAKGFDVLLRAFSLLPEADSCLLVVGDGPERKNLQTLAESLNLKNRVEFLGYRSHQELSGILNSSDAFVLASHSETFGVVFIEAMAAGLPIIATKCGGPEDFVKDTNGMLVNVGDVEGLAEAMHEMIRDIDRFSRVEISQYARNHFSAAAIAGKINSVYDELK